jgi:hypothetical protein
VVDLDASIVFAASDKENAQPTYKGGIGFCPNLATDDNTDDMLAIDPRPGGATSNCAADNIALLDLAVSQLPGRYRRRVLVRLDEAGFLPRPARTHRRRREHEGPGLRVLGRLVVHRHRNGRDRAPAQGCLDGRDRAERRPRRGHLRRRPDRPTRPRPLARQDLRPADHRARRTAAPPLPQTGHRTGEASRPPLPTHRHQHQGRAARLARRPPSLPRPRGERRQTGQRPRPEPLALRHWAINVAWTQIVALAANLLACLRHLALPEGELHDAAPKLLRYRLLHLRSCTVAFAFAAEAPLLGRLPRETFDTARLLRPRVDTKARVCVRQSFYSVPARYAGRRLTVRLGATTVEALDGARVVADHDRALGRYAEVLTLDHYLEVLKVKPGALAGATALAQAKAAGVFTQTHQRYWDAVRQARGDTAGTKALVEILLAHRTQPAAALIAAMDTAVASMTLDPQVVLIEARRHTARHPAPVIPIAELDRYDRPPPCLTGYDELLTGSTT